MIKNIKSQTDLSGIYIVYKGASLLEDRGNYGIAHLMEHLVCKSYEKYQDKLDIDGITANAYTSTNEIVFYFTGLDTQLNKWKDILVNGLFDFNITKEDFETERSIVLQEYLDSFNSQNSAHFYNFMRKKFNSFSAIGLKKDLENLTFLDCLDFFKKQYSKADVIINVSKHNNYHNGFLDYSGRNIDYTFKLNDYKVEEERLANYKEKDDIIMYNDIYTDKPYLIKIISNMLSFGLQSPLYKEIREKRGLAYYVYMSGVRMSNQMFPMIGTSTTPNKSQEFEKVVNDILLNYKKYLTKERFDIICSSMKNNFEISKINRYNNVNLYIDSNKFRLEDKIDNLNFDNVLEYASILFNKPWQMNIYN